MRFVSRNRRKQAYPISLARARRIALAMQRRRDLVHEAREWARYEDDGGDIGGDTYTPGPLFDTLMAALQGTTARRSR